MKGLVSPLSFIISFSIVLLFIIFMDSIEIPTIRKRPPRIGATSFLLNLPSFEYLINNQACMDNLQSNVQAVMIITSHAGNVATRQAHRLALPKELLFSIGVRRVFLLAVSSGKESSQTYKAIKQQEIFNEDVINGDLIQGNFKEAYRNLTYKHMMGLEWVSKFCQMANYVIKMDDDIILDIFQLLKTLPNVLDNRNNFLLGYMLKGMKPIRNPTNKWFVSEKEYPKAYYPPFLSGWMYVTTPEVVSKIVWNSQQNKHISSQKNSYRSFFWIDDVFVTGILSRQAGVELIDFSKYFAIHPQYLQCCIETAVISRSHKTSMPELNSCEFIVGPSGGDMELLQKFIKEAKWCWRSDKLCGKSTYFSQMAKTCVVGRGEAYDWVRRPFSRGEAILKRIKL
ncbi:beta-1,3-galactosyltransferase 1 [Hetaerina americana]|uniref:beta-1,3-galactosyltransferase 1 n=1 Tax=Hetaerina americana TaxID=62018 RepID=UPI003A7F2219